MVTRWPVMYKYVYFVNYSKKVSCLNGKLYCVVSFSQFSTNETGPQANTKAVLVSSRLFASACISPATSGLLPLVVTYFSIENTMLPLLMILSLSIIPQVSSKMSLIAFDLEGQMSRTRSMCAYLLLPSLIAKYMCRRQECIGVIPIPPAINKRDLDESRLSGAPYGPSIMTDTCASSVCESPASWTSLPVHWSLPIFYTSEWESILISCVRVITLMWWLVTTSSGEDEMLKGCHSNVEMVGILTK